jgi:hypothetical protein
VPVELSRREVFSISVARKLLERSEGTPLELDMGSVLTKIKHTTGFALLIKTPGATRRFSPGEGETIAILDKNGKETWSVKIPTLRCGLFALFVVER